MNKKGQGAIIAMSIGAILLVVILGVIFGTLSDQTTTTSVGSDQFTAANGTCVRVTTTAAECILKGSTTAIVNDTNQVDVLANFTECSTGGVTVNGYNMVSNANADLTGATVNATYTEIGCGYITSATTRTLINLLPVLLGIAVLIFIVGFIALKR